MNNNELYKRIVSEEVFPALGCTEPIAIAYAVSIAKDNISEEIKRILLKLDKETYKNAVGVYIPNSNNNMGIDMAATLGLFGNSKKEMQVLEDLGEEEIKNAIEYKNKKIVDIEIVDGKDMFISAELFGDFNKAKVVIKNSHKNISLIEKNGNIIFENKENKDELKKMFEYQYLLMEKNLDDLLEIAKSITDEDIEYIKKGIKMQLEIGEYFKNNFVDEYKKLENSYTNPFYSQELTQILLKGVTATYARMSGVNKPVMSSGGSGNQGIVAILLPYLYGTEILGLDKNDRKIYESIALSNIINSYVKCYTGATSTMCGCAVAAGEGAVAAMLYQNGLENKIGIGLDNMIASSGGLICDGAKIGCYNKVASSIVNSFNAVNQAMSDLGVSYSDGIIGKDPLESIRNISSIANNENINDVILGILKSKI